jgi:hypothetical protein
MQPCLLRNQPSLISTSFVIERADEDLVTWNCTAARDAGGTIVIQPYEDLVSGVHVNFRRPHQVSAAFRNTSPLRSC